MKNSRNLVVTDDLKIVGRATAKVRPRLDIVVPESGLSFQQV